MKLMLSPKYREVKSNFFEHKSPKPVFGHLKQPSLLLCLFALYCVFVLSTTYTIIHTTEYLYTIFKYTFYFFYYCIFVIVLLFCLYSLICPFLLLNLMELPSKGFSHSNYQPFEVSTTQNKWVDMLP